MHRTRVGLTVAVAAVALLSLAAAPPRSALVQGSTVPVISLKNFTSVSEWQLDITWTAKDAFEDADRSATLDMTATARLFLVQSDKTDAWGRWHVEKVQSWNLSIASLLVNKNDHSRTEYKSNPAGLIDGAAIFEVGGRTPGYQLISGIAFPVMISNPMIGPMDSIITLLTSDISGSTPVFLTGPLPAPGPRPSAVATIQGSVVFPMCVPPFCSDPIPTTRVGVQFVLKEVPLAPLVPARKK